MIPSFVGIELVKYANLFDFIIQCWNACQLHFVTL